MRLAARTPLISFAAILAVLVLGVQPAEASRPFTFAELQRASDDGFRNRLLIKTVTNADKPNGVLARAEGAFANARERRHGRWLVTPRTHNGRVLLRSMRAALESSNQSVLHASGRYRCGARFRVSFAIGDYNERAPSHFKSATGCV